MQDIVITEPRTLHIINPDILNIRKNLSQGGSVTYGDGKISDINIPTTSGIYLIGEVNYEDDTQYLVHKVKVGQGQNLFKRLSTYTTYTTSVKLLDTLSIYSTLLDKEEGKYQNILRQYGWQVGHTEWYVLSEKNYKILKTYGFSGFNKLKI